MKLSLVFHGVAALALGAAAGRWTPTMGMAKPVTETATPPVKPKASKASSKPKATPLPSAPAEIEQAMLALGSKDANKLMELAKQLAKTDVGRALELLYQLDHGKGSKRTLENFIDQELEPGHYAEVLSFLRRHDDLVKAHHGFFSPANVLEHIVSYLAQENPMAAWTALFEEMKGVNPMMITAFTEEALEGRDARILCDWLASRAASFPRTFAMALSAGEWAETDSLAASEWAIAHSLPAFVLREVTISKADPKTVAELSHLVELGGDILSRHDIGRLIEKLSAHLKDKPDWGAWLSAGLVRDLALAKAAQNDPMGDIAKRALEQIGDAEERRKVTSTVAATLAAKDLTAAFAYANALPDETARELARRSIVATASVEEKVRHYLQQPGAWDIHSVAALAGEWSLASPKDAAQAVSKVSDPMKRGAMFDAVFQNWLKASPAGASAWALTLPPGAVRDDASAALAAAAVNEEPESAMLWAYSVGDAGRRTQVMDQAFSNWASMEPEAASAWLASGAGGADDSTQQRLGAILASVGTRPARIVLPRPLRFGQTVNF